MNPRFRDMGRARTRLAVLAALVVAGSSRPVFAQDDGPNPESERGTKADEDSAAKKERQFRFEFGFGAGYHHISNKSGFGRRMGEPDALAPESAPVAIGRLSLNFNQYLSAEAEVDVSVTHTRGIRSSVGAGTDLGIYGYRGQLLLHLVPTGRFRPFILGGYGGYSIVAENESVVQTDHDGSIHFGAGFKAYFSDRVGLRVDGHMHIPPSTVDSVIPTGDDTDKNAKDFVIVGTLFFNTSEIIETERKFFHEKVVVEKQAPPPPPPPAPPADPDGDGLAGTADRCPNDPEDQDGYKDDDGCPEPDNDSDGILDTVDKCPDVAETPNGIDDDDGCPEEDTDGDGFIGSADRCPAAPETKNNFEDQDGCPDEIPAQVKRFTGVIKGINFETNSARILPGSFALLDEAVAVLNEYKDVRLEISGHTDSRGPDAYNLDLSQKRADSVRYYFIQKGIDANRLTSVGHGEGRPLADNMTRSGRAANRRTEFRLVGGN